MKTKKCLKEWNATIEALGRGIQTILIRNYRTNTNNFLLYPTANYTVKDNYLDSFQDKYQKFVYNNSLPEKKENKVLIKYYASLEKIIEMPISKIPSIKNYIWTKGHVKNYMTGKTVFIWVLRVYKLNEPYWTEFTPGIRFANLNEEISLDNMKPVLSDGEFEKVFEEIK